MQKRFLDKPTLKIYESGMVWLYRRAFTVSGLPYYIPPPEKEGLHRSVFMNEAMFFPIEYEEFKTNREDYFYGYRFIIATPGYTTIGIPQGPAIPCPLSYIQLGFESARVRFFMEDDEEHDMVIDFMGDSMFPTRTVEIQQHPNQIAATVNNIIFRLIDEYCVWYSTRKI